MLEEICQWIDFQILFVFLDVFSLSSCALRTSFPRIFTVTDFDIAQSLFSSRTTSHKQKKNIGVSLYTYMSSSDPPRIIDMMDPG